ncbi:unnamed protein product [Fusarium langsethiae]|nr:unnamed protein product [Fusarium langsethiae]GKU14060.1 unnamed protein product [Fusarium langsethiae]
MSTSTISPVRRALGWNIVFLAGPDGEKFAGVFHPPGSDSLTYRHILEEFRLCFVIPPVDLTSTSPWDEVSFFPAGTQGGYRRPLQNNAQVLDGRLISSSGLDTPVATLPFVNSPHTMSEPSVTRLHVIRHTDCDLHVTEPLEAHIKNGCAYHIPIPTLRREPRYLPPNKPSKDPRFTQLPYRKTVRARGSQSPSKSPKRSASGTSSPTKGIPDGADTDVTEVVTPPGFEMDVENAKKEMASFRSSCLSSNYVCAVTGKGRSWFGDSNIGPAIQACHIVPQQHYHTYPTPEDPDMQNPYSHQRLRAAWQRTWSVKNGILLLSHLHELFDARLFSIHPETLKIRVFVPYDVILEYHDKEAQINWEVDPRALRHHYDMCCIENMTAQMPWSEEIIVSQPPTPSQKSGAMSPFGQGPHIPRMTSERGADGRREDTPGDPTKKTRQDEPHDCDQISDQMSLTTDNSSPMGSARHDLSPPDGLARKRGYKLDETGQVDMKRRRIVDQEDVENADYGSDSEFQTRNRYWDGCITPSNSLEFLSDVNYQLQRLIP